MTTSQFVREIEILLVEDNPGDVRLTIEALKEGRVRNNLEVAMDGAEALDRLYQRGEFKDVDLPDLILLDLNLPKMSGVEVLKTIKQDSRLKRIPVVVLTTSEAEEDIVDSYDSQANAYVTKPVDLSKFVDVIRKTGDYWLQIVKLPDRK